MQITRYDLYKRPAKGYYPASVYVMTYDDGHARIFRKDESISAWKIYKTFDEAAAIIDKMTSNNTYVLATIPDEDDAWTYWAKDEHAFDVRYDYASMSLDQKRRIRDADRWQTGAGIILKDHYCNDLPLFTNKQKPKRLSEKLTCPF